MAIAVAAGRRLNLDADTSIIMLPPPAAERTGRGIDMATGGLLPVRETPADSTDRRERG